MYLQNAPDFRELLPSHFYFMMAALLCDLGFRFAEFCIIFITGILVIRVSGFYDTL